MNTATTCAPPFTAIAYVPSVAVVELPYSGCPRMVTATPANGVALGSWNTFPRTSATCAGLIAGPPTMLAMFVATVPFRVGTQVLGVVVTPASVEHVDVKQAFAAVGV